MSQETARRLPPVWLLVLAAAISPFAMNMTIPATSEIMRQFQTSYGEAQMILTVFLASLGVAQFVLGPLADRFGRRPLMLWGMLVFAIGSLMCALATTMEWLWLGRAIQGVGAAAGFTLSRTMVRDIYSLEKSASVIGYITMAMVVMPMMGPVIGGLITQYVHWRVLFWGLLVLAIVAQFLMHQKLNETRPPRDPQAPEVSMLASIGVLVKNRVFVGYTLASSFCASLYFAFVGGAPYIVMEIMGSPPAEYGVFFILSACGYMSGNFLSGRYAMRFGPERMVRIGLVVAAISVLCFWAFMGVMHPLAMFAPMMVAALSNGLVIPNATALFLSARPEIAGAASGLAGAFQTGLGAFITLLVGYLQDDGQWRLYTVMSVCLGTAIAGYLLAHAPLVRQTGESQEENLS